MRKTFVNTVIEIAKTDPKLVVLIGDISHYLFKDFEKMFPNRFYNMGICEQSIVGLAAGLALEGFKPIVHTISPFCVNRAFEQIKIDVCYQDLNVTFATVGGSFDYAHLGCTHHCYEDISLMMTLPNMQVYNPGGDAEFHSLFKSAWKNNSPKYFKINKDVHNHSFDVKPGEIRVLNKENNEDCIVFANGPILRNLKNIKNTIIYTPNVSDISHTSVNQIFEIVKQNKTKKIITVEENLTIGSFGDKILNIFQEFNVPIIYKKIGIPKKFLKNYGSANEHRRFLKIDMSSLEQSIHEFNKL